jgi:PAS domain S-box-containing protein
VTLFTALRSRFVHPLPPLAGFLSLAIGGLVLFGWAIDSTALKSLAPGYNAMMPNAALCFVLVGASLLSTALRPKTTSSELTALSSAAATTIIGLMSSLEYLLGLKLVTVGPWMAGRMGGNTAVCFVLLGTALLLKIKRATRHDALGDGCTLGAILLAYTAFLGSLFHEQFFLDGVGQQTPMALHAALTVLLVGTGTLALHPGRGLIAVLTSDQAGGYMLRRLLPGMLLILPAIGWIQLYGERRGLSETPMGVAFFATMTTVALFGLLWWTASSMNEADKARRRSDQLFASFMSNLPALAWIKDIEGRYVYLNDAFTRSFGVRLEDWRDKTDREVLPAAVATQFQANDARVVATKRAVVTMETAPYKDGLHESVVSKFPIVDEDGLLALVGGVAVDITERNRIEMALRESEEQFRQVTGHIQEVFWLSDASKSAILYVSPAYESIWGRSCASIYLSPRSWLEAIHPDDQARVLEAALTKQVAGTYDEEYRIVRPDGSIRWIRDRAFPVRDASGLVSRIAGIADDITERKKVEAELQQAHDQLERRVAERTAALQESQQRLEMAFHGAGLASWDWNVETGAVIYNERWAQIRGFSLDEVEVHISSRMNGIHPEDLPFVDQQLKACLAGNIGEYEAEMRVHTRAGEWTWILDRGRVIERDAQGKPSRMAGVEIDITARKRGELELKRAQAFLMSVLENIPNMVFVKDAQDLRFVQFNKAGEELLGYSRHQLAGKNDYDCFPKDEADFFTEKDREVLATQRLLDIPSEPIQTKERGIRILHTKKIPLYDEAGKPQYLLGISEDITERMQAEQALRESEQRYSSLVSQATDIIYTASLDGRFAFVNAAACSIMGYREEELLGKHYLELVREDFRETAQRFYQRQLAERVPSTYLEFPAMTKDGREIWFGQRVQLRFKEHTVVGVEAICRDITARKVAEQALEERAQCAVFAAEVSLLLNHDEPLDRMLQRCTDAAVQHLGAAFTRIWLLKPGDLCAECHKAPLCRNRTMCLHLHASSGLSTNLNGEFRRVPLGALKIGAIAQGQGVLFTNDVLQDDRLPNKSWMREQRLRSFAGFPLVVEGQVFGVLGLFSRDTMSEAKRQTIESVCNGLAASIARKQATEALQQSEMRTRAIIESALDAVVTIDEQGAIIGWNSQATAIFGYEEWEVRGRLLSETIVPPRHREAHIKGLRRFLSSGEGPILNRRVELSALHKDGREFPIELSLTAMTIEDRKVFSAFLRDISERKQAEMALQEAFERRRELTRRLTQAEEVERRRIARELHDEFGQVLTGLKFDVAWLSKRLSRMNGSAEAVAMKSKAAAMSDSVDGLIQSVRATVAALRPGVLDDLGLVAAIEWLVGSFRERTGLPCELTIDPMIRETVIESELATTVFRSAQELLTNVMRHAQASTVSVRLRAEEGQLKLAIRDDGRGIQPQEWERGRSLGLRGLHERVKLIGGTVTIVGSPGLGTEVSIALPMKSDVASPAKERT